MVGHECVQCLLQAVKNHCPDQKVVPCLQQTNQGYRYAALDILVIFHPTFLVQMQQPYLFAPQPLPEHRASLYPTLSPGPN